MSLLLTTLTLLGLIAPGDTVRCASRVTGSLESATAVYFDDKALGGRPQVWGSNNYLKLGWQRDSLSAGLQAEWYPKALAGYPSELKGAGLTGAWLYWRHKGLDLTAGTFHEQFGSGLVLRTWEDRDLGINNNLTGTRVKFRTGALELKALAGLPKFGMWPSASGMVTGGDLSLDFLALGGRYSEHSLRAGASFMDHIAFRQEDGISLLASSSGFTLPGHVFSWSGRLAYSYRGFSVQGEYAGKSDDFYVRALPGATESYSLSGGNAELVEINYAAGSFSGTLTMRRLENMQSHIFHTASAQSVANTLNYLPALCAQQTYMLAGLNPYETFAAGEAGLQGDLYYKFRRGTALGGRYGMTLHVGGSWIEGLPCALPDRSSSHLAYRDINIDLERRWTRNFRTILFVSIQENSPTHGNRKATNAQNVFVLDALYRFTRQFSARLELQYLYSQELSRDWMAALLEVSLAPHWSFSVSDMYNHGGTGVNYYNIAASYTYSSLSLSLQAGRNREGIICSGGVCRWQPAWSGVMLRAQWSF